MMNMKSKSFCSVPGAAVIPLSCLFTAVISVGMLIICLFSGQLSPPLLCGYMLFVLSGVFGAIYSSQQAMCSVVLYNDHLLCKIPFGKNFEMIYDKCYVGMDYHVQNGGKIWWIYLCYGKMPPYKSPHLGNRINSVKCQPGFVRLMYRDEVYAELLNVLPKKQRAALISAHRLAGLEERGK